MTIYEILSIICIAFIPLAVMAIRKDIIRTRLIKELKKHESQFDTLVHQANMEAVEYAVNHGYKSPYKETIQEVRAKIIEIKKTLKVKP